MTRHILQSDLQGLTNEQSKMISRGMEKGLGACEDRNGLVWLGGISEIFEGTGEIWLCPLMKIDSKAWRQIKNFYFWARDAYGFKRVQSYVNPDTPKGTLTMLQHFGITLETTLKKWYDGQDVFIYSWVRN